jgi:hypothetical protein
MTGTAAQAVVLQLPYEGVLQKGGIAFVLKQPGVQTQWLLSEQGKDFFVGFEKVRGKQSCISAHEQNVVILNTVDAFPCSWFPQAGWVLDSDQEGSEGKLESVADMPKQEPVPAVALSALLYALWTLGKTVATKVCRTLHCLTGRIGCCLVLKSSCW